MNPRGTIGRIYEEDHYTLLLTKYKSSGPCGFGEDFLCFSHCHTCDSSRIVREDPGNEDHIPASRKASRISRMLNFPIIFFSKLSI